MTIGVGLIGYGLAGRLLHSPFLAPAGFSLKAVATRRANEVKADCPDAAVVAQADEIFSRDDVELVVVVAPNDVHFDLAARALEAGKHVVIDKPMTVTVLEADMLLDRAASARRILTVYQNRRFDGDFLTVQTLVRAGRLGRVVLFEAVWDRFRPHVQPRWREEQAQGGGVLIDLGAHLVDQVLQLFGWPEWVEGDVLRQRDRTAVDDGFSIRLAYGRMRAVCEVSLFGAAPRPRFRISGERGTFVKPGLDPQEAQLRAGMAPTDPAFGEEPEEQRGSIVGETGVSPHPGERGQWQSFWTGLAAAIRSGAPAPVDAAESRDALHILECARDSSDRGHRIVPQPPRSARYAGA